MIILSPEAERLLREMMETRPGKVPRIHFQETGIGMPELKVGWSERKEQDLVEEVRGIPFILDEDVSYFSPHLVIDCDPRKNREFRVIPRGDDACDGDCGRCSGCPEP